MTKVLRPIRRPNGPFKGRGVTLSPRGSSGSFSQSMALRASGRRGVKANHPSCVETAKIIRNELRSVVGDDFVGETVAANDILPNEVLYFLIGYLD